jgi:hypothetical protein
MSVGGRGESRRRFETRRAHWPKPGKAEDLGFIPALPPPQERRVGGGTAELPRARMRPSDAGTTLIVTEREGSIQRSRRVERESGS